MRKVTAIIAVAAVGSLALAGCGTPTDEASSAAGGSGSGSGSKDYLACMVSDSGGFDDKSFNETSYNGLKNAEKDLGIKTKTAESSSDADFVPNVDAMVSAGCNLIITVGYLLGDATQAAAEANPNIDFAIVDSTPEKAVDNFKGIVFDTAQAAFLAGYLSAGMTKTGTVATFGGQKIPSVTIFMDGYVEGVNYYNQQKGTTVKTLGWDPTTQDGTFTGDFEDQAKGKSTTQDFIAQGADIIHPVAGPVGLGSVSAAKEASGTKIIWPDTDGYKSVEGGASVILSSVVKGMDVAVENTITDAYNGKFSSENYVGTLANDGVSLAEYHDFDSQVPAELKSEIDQLKQDIISGKVKVESPSSPATS